MAETSRKFALVKQFLILSLSLNALFVCLFLYFLIRNDPVHFSFSPRIYHLGVTHPPLKNSILKRLSRYGYEQLVEMLKDERKADKRYTVRDLALGALVWLHDFDIEKALDKPIGLDRKELVLFSSLQNGDFEKIIDFMAKEKWPFTSRGLFRKIKQGEKDPVLLHKFIHTPEFLALETLFLRHYPSLKRMKIFTLAIEGEWDALNNFYQAQREQADFSEIRLEKILVEYHQKGSLTAERLLLSQETSPTLSKRLDPRPKMGELRPVFRDKPSPALPPSTTHIIQPGETLWMIAKKYGVSLETLMEENHLPSTTVQPGKMLKLPLIRG